MAGWADLYKICIASQIAYGQASLGLGQPIRIAGDDTYWYRLL
jgi:hypothetical protein